MRGSLFVIGITLIVLFTGIGIDEDLNEDRSVQEFLLAMGEDAPAHYIAEPDAEKVRMGYELVHNGRTRLPDGANSRFISKFYVCTDCHNQVQEDPILTDSNPDTRLQYTIDKGIPFLQATTFWGMVNRETWYNDDYVLKYGAFVEKANKSLAESTQLCAKECSSGRYLEEWELDAIMHYYNTLGLKLSDLDLTESDKELVIEALTNQELQESAVAKLKENYALRSPAHFSKKAPDWDKYAGNVNRGEALYKASCMSCHRPYGPSQLILDTDKFTLNKFKRNQGKDSWFDLHTITRYGTSAEPGHRQYMPLYPLERMSEQQLADLRAFVLQ